MEQNQIILHKTKRNKQIGRPMHRWWNIAAAKTNDLIDMNKQNMTNSAAWTFPNTSNEFLLCKRTEWSVCRQCQHKQCVYILYIFSAFKRGLASYLCVRVWVCMLVCMDISQHFSYIKKKPWVCSWICVTHLLGYSQLGRYSAEHNGCVIRPDWPGRRRSPQGLQLNLARVKRSTLLN